MALFNKDEGNSMTRKTHGSPQIMMSIVSVNSAFDGHMETDGDFHVNGKIKGKVEVKGHTKINAEGLLVGEMITRNATISGTIEGDIVVSEVLILTSTSKVSGSIHAGRLIIEKGAIFNGECRMGQRVKNSISSNGTSVQSDVPALLENTL